MFVQSLILRAKSLTMKSIFLKRGNSGLVFVNWNECSTLPVSKVSLCYLRELQYFLHRSNMNKIGAVYFNNLQSLAPASFVGEILNNLIGYLDDNCEVTMHFTDKNADAIMTCIDHYESIRINRLCMQVTDKSDFIQQFFNHKVTLSYDFTLPCLCSTQTAKNLDVLLDQMIRDSSHIKIEQPDCLKCTNFTAADDLFIDQYEHVKKYLQKAAFSEYKFCHFAKQQNLSKFMNLTSLGASYIGLGPGSHGRLICGGTGKRVAYANEPDMVMWMRKVERHSNGVEEIKTQSKSEILSEILIHGLDTLHGVSLKNWMQYSNGGTFKDLVDNYNIRPLVDEGIIISDGKHLALSEEYWIVSDSIVNLILESIEEQIGLQE